MTAPTTLDPSRTALLVMDYQGAALAMVPNGAQLLENMARAIVDARTAGVRIVYVHVGFAAQDCAAIPGHNKIFAGMSAAGIIPLDGTPEGDVHRDIAPQDGDIVVNKTRVGAFSTTNLALFVSPRDIDNLVLAGISTSGVVLSTLRDAADRDYRLFVLSDCCADPNPDVHRVLVEDVFTMQADLVTTQALSSLLGVDSRL